MNRIKHGLKTFAKGAAAASAMATALPATASAQTAHDKAGLEHLLKHGEMPPSADELAYRQANMQRAYQKAGTHPKAAKPGFHADYYKHTGTVLDHLQDTDAILGNLVHDKNLLAKLDGLSLTEKHNILLYALTAYHENREEGFLGMVAVTRVLENRVKNKYRGGETPEEQLAQLAQFTYVGQTPLHHLTNGKAEPQAWDLAFRVGYYTVKGADMAQSRGILNSGQLSEAAILTGQMGDCMHYLTDKAAESNGRLAEPQFRDHGLLKTREGSKHVYLVPPEKER